MPICHTTFGLRPQSSQCGSMYLSSLCSVVVVVEGDGTVAFYGQVHHSQSTAEPLCLTLFWVFIVVPGQQSPHTIIYLTLAALLAGFVTLIPPSDGTGHSNFQRSVDFGPSFLPLSCRLSFPNSLWRSHHGGYLTPMVKP